MCQLFTADDRPASEPHLVGPELYLDDHALHYVVRVSMRCTRKHPTTVRLFDSDGVVLLKAVAGASEARKGDIIDLTVRSHLHPNVVETVPR